MRARITEEGLLIPREVAERAFGQGSGEVEIFEEPGRLLISPAADGGEAPPGRSGRADGEDPFFRMGEDPVDDEVADASSNHDRYLYKGG